MAHMNVILIFDHFQHFHIIMVLILELHWVQCFFFVLRFILYTKLDNTTMFDAFMWNKVKNNVCDDVILIASYINQWNLLAHNPWNFALTIKIPKFLNFITLINNTLIKIQKPWNIETHKPWFNIWHEKIYSQITSWFFIITICSFIWILAI
jgi:hypothetical protein